MKSFWYNLFGISKYWYYAYEYNREDGVKGTSSRMISVKGGEFFSVLIAESFIKKDPHITAVVITFWSEISKEEFKKA